MDRRLLRMPHLMKDLDSYLNDHLAGSISALELIAHWVEAHKGEPLGSFFVEIEREIKALGQSGLPRADWIAQSLLAAAPQMP